MPPYAQNPAVQNDAVSTREDHRTSESKPSFQTTELIAYVVVALAVLIASAVVDKSGYGQGPAALPRPAPGVAL